MVVDKILNGNLYFESSWIINLTGDFEKRRYRPNLENQIECRKLQNFSYRINTEKLETQIQRFENDSISIDEIRDHPNVYPETYEFEFDENLSILVILDFPSQQDDIIWNTLSSTDQLDLNSGIYRIQLVNRNDITNTNVRFPLSEMENLINSMRRIKNIIIRSF